jgi:hypothetical protein
MSFGVMKRLNQSWPCLLLKEPVQLSSRKWWFKCLHKTLEPLNKEPSSSCFPHEGHIYPAAISEQIYFYYFRIRMSTHGKTRERLLKKREPSSCTKELRLRKGIFLVFLTWNWLCWSQPGYSNSGLTMEQSLDITKYLAIHGSMRQEGPGQHKVRGSLS